MPYNLRSKQKPWSSQANVTTNRSNRKKKLEEATQSKRADVNDGSHKKNVESTLTKKFKELYEDITKSPSFSAKIEAFLRNNDNYAIHTPIRRKIFPRRRVITRFPNELWMADLIEYNKYTKRFNQGYNFILVIIDCFSKRMWAKPLKTKSGHETARAFESILFGLDDFPVNLCTDSGKEFFNYDCMKVFEAHGINHYSVPTKSKFKASIVERAIRTLKTRLQRYFHKHKTRKWIDIIDQFVKNYNLTPHRSHGLKPLDVSSENRDEVYKRLYPRIKLKTDCKFQKGDKVRHLLNKTLFEKGYTQTWTEEIYTVADVRQSNLVCWYILHDHTDSAISGIWYYNQLKLVSKNVDQSDRQDKK